MTPVVCIVGLAYLAGLYSIRNFYLFVMYMAVPIALTVWLVRSLG